MTTTMILLVEDELNLQAVHSRFLRRTFPESHVVVADTASRAIAALSLCLFDLVVSDWDLRDPTEHGGTILTWVRKNQPALLPRFVFLTGKAGVEQVHQPCVMKGSPAAELRATLTAVMQQPTV